MQTAFLLFLAAYIMWHLLVVLLGIHEYGHLLAMKRVGIRPDKVVIGGVKLFTITIKKVPIEFGLVPLWAFVASKHYEQSSSDKRAIVAAAGPAMSLVTGIAFFLVDAIYPLWLVGLCAKGSFVLLATNLIPLPPLDGWTIIEHFIVRRGIKISPKSRQYLLCAGFLAIALVALLV
ncbi:MULTISPECIES: site-2 protease family protein [unclassified Cupriavidus]|jgi:Zn-dependent protease|uniref:site-2 protease family protein n=1 Tax=unclassified Cupriavidus TaxID=2640874 RepID=UPI0010F88019|nr:MULTISPECIES: site-2 protease family protein [unclassified Cupriavidus]QWE98133.1 site-2 protease family protein [Cupriavidus sp. EM10]